MVYRRLFNRRQKGDYDDLVTFVPADIETWIGKVKVRGRGCYCEFIQKWEQENRDKAE